MEFLSGEKSLKAIWQLHSHLCPSPLTSFSSASLTSFFAFAGEQPLGNSCAQESSLLLRPTGYIVPQSRTGEGVKHSFSHSRTVPPEERLSVRQVVWDSGTRPQVYNLDELSTGGMSYPLSAHGLPHSVLGHSGPRASAHPLPASFYSCGRTFQLWSLVDLQLLCQPGGWDIAWEPGLPPSSFQAQLLATSSALLPLRPSLFAS